MFGHISRSSGLAKTILNGTVLGKKEKIDRMRGGKTILRNGQRCTLVAELGQLKTELAGEGLL